MSRGGVSKINKTTLHLDLYIQINTSNVRHKLQVGCRRIEYYKKTK